MAKEVVHVGFANEGERILDVELVSKWEPKNINYVGDTVFFKHDGSYFSMRIIDFKKIFKL